jgi:phosphatidylinositol-3-phosphatase
MTSRSTIAPTPSAPVSASALVKPPPSVMIVVLENHGYGDVIGNASAPQLNALAQHYGLATRSYACCHPSLPNYLDMISGSTFGISSDCTTCSVDGTTIVDQMVHSGHDWRAYMESMPSPCFMGDSASGLYAKKHDPFMYFAHIRNDGTACGKVQPFSAFYPALDAGQLPAFTFVTPNLCNDGHDCSLRQSDTWVGGFVSRVTTSSWFAGGGVLIITYDEGTSSDGCCQGAAGGHIATWVVSRGTPPGARDATAVDHAGLLRTVEELYGLPLLGSASCACSGDLLGLIGH